ncbi:MAG: D-hexose-6-phosphate mutarotase [Phycisphaeraceae bacterium]|nr:D-hexose-6-phosphate mutarotase [Phycisphaeraceae bacterium]
MPNPPEVLDTDTLRSLNERLGIADRVKFEPGPGQLAVAKLSGTDGSTARIALHGAHVLSYTPGTGQEAVAERDLLFVSRASWWEPGRPIRGGIPVCFPWFGPHPEHADWPAHGFARLRSWKIASTRLDASGEPVLALALESDASTAAYFPHHFAATLTVRLGQRLEIALDVRNLNAPGQGQPALPFSFEAALHTYFQVGDVRQVAVHGLQGTRYLDKVAGMAIREDDQPAVRFEGETDRVYMDTSADCIIDDASTGRRILVAKDGSNSTVVWNPWIDKAARMPDFGDEEWPRMVCVETANVGTNAVTLEAGDEHSLKLAIGLAEA